MTHTKTMFVAPHDNLSDRPQRVAVIGAGLAGLACADKLVAAGHCVDVFEARGRVGGRVLSHHLPRSAGIVEAGGEFIGRSHTQWQRLASEFGLTLAPTTEIDDSQWIFRGRPIPAAQHNDIHRTLAKFHASMTYLAESVDSAAPWSTASAKFWDSKSVRQWLDQQAEQDPTHYRAMLADVEGLNGIPAENQSMLAHLSQIHGGGLEDYWTESQTDRCVGGNDQLASALHQRIGQKRVHLNQVVTSLQPASSSRGPALVFNHGGRWQGDAVVMTAPPPTWNQLTFKGGMPLQERPQLSRTLKHVSYISNSVSVASTSSHHSDDRGITYEMWPVAAKLKVPHAVVTFVPIGQRVPLRSLQTHIETSLRQLTSQTHTSWGHKLFDWSQEPFSQGGYAFAAPGEIGRVGKRLYSQDRGLLFAGDWAQYSHAGYMEGALRAGLRAADLIIGA